jgi:hypothetical protein
VGDIPLRVNSPKFIMSSTFIILPYPYVTCVNI